MYSNWLGYNFKNSQASDGLAMCQAGKIGILYLIVRM